MPRAVSGVVDDNHKRCSKCKEVKPKTEFHKNKKNGKTYLRSACKTCTAKLWQSNKAKYKESAKSYYQKNRKKIIARCKENYKNNCDVKRRKKRAAAAKKKRAESFKAENRKFLVKLHSTNSTLLPIGFENELKP